MSKTEASKLIYKYKLTTYLVPQEDGMYITHNDTVGLDVASLPLYLYWDKVKHAERN
jgi:hypothetical protein